MIKADNISSFFPRHLFWDVEPEHLDVQMDKDLIIPRALFATTSRTFDADISKLETLYSRADIASVLKATKEHVSNKVCELVVHRYHIPVFYRFSPDLRAKQQMIGLIFFEKIVFDKKNYRTIDCRKIISLISRPSADCSRNKKWESSNKSELSH